MGADLYFMLRDEYQQDAIRLKNENQELLKRVADLEYSLKNVLEELSPNANTHHRSLVLNALLA